MARPGRDAPGTAPSVPRRPGTAPACVHRDLHGRPAACRNPGLLDDSGLASASRPRIARGPQAPGRQPGHPGARSLSPAASGRPGRAPVHPCAVTRDQLHRQGDGLRGAAGRHDGRGRQRITAIQGETLLAACADTSERCMSSSPHRPYRTLPRFFESYRSSCRAPLRNRTVDLLLTMDSQISC